MCSGLHEVRVSDVMVPRADIICVPIDASLAAVLATFRTAGHSRFPVIGETLDDPRGMVHIRDFVDFVAAAAEKILTQRRAKSNGAALRKAASASCGEPERPFHAGRSWHVA